MCIRDRTAGRVRQADQDPRGAGPQGAHPRGRDPQGARGAGGPRGRRPASRPAVDLERRHRVGRAGRPQPAGPDEQRRPAGPQQCAGQLRVRPALPPDPPDVATARRARLRRRLRVPGLRRDGRHGHRGQPAELDRWLRQPDRHRPRHQARLLARDDLQPPAVLRGPQRSRQSRSGHRLRRHDRHVDRLPPALRDPGQRHPGRPPRLALTSLRAQNRWRSGCHLGVP